MANHPETLARRLGDRAACCLMVVTAVFALAAGCGDRGSSASSPPDAAAKGAAKAVCDAAAAAERGSLSDAGSRFLDVHAELHVIANRLSGKDRAAAARLLEAKQKVEADFARPAGSDLAGDMKRLAHVVAKEQGQPTPTRCR